MSNAEMKKHIEANINKLAKFEKGVHDTVNELAYDLLNYVPETGDIASVNRMLSVLTNNNRKAAIEFFKYFLPWNFDDEKGIFTDKKGGARINNSTRERRHAFLANPNETFWTWAKEHVEIKRKPTDYGKRLETALSSALDPEKGNLSKTEVLLSVMGAGIRIDDMLDLIEEFNKAGRENKKAA